MDGTTRETLERLWWAGVERAGGYEAVEAALASGGDAEITHVAAVGKAGSQMIRAALDVCGQSLPALLVTKHGHAEPSLRIYPGLEIIESGHPLPDENSIEAGDALIRFVSGAGAGARLLLLVSGGASALAESLPPGMTLADWQAVTRSMLAEGLDIHAINARRREISQIKGGRLLARFSGTKALVLAISDVEGDAISVIGSGIGEIPAQMRHGDFEARIIASNAIAREACENMAGELGLDVIVSSESLYGDVAEVAVRHAGIVRQGAPGLYVFGGEPTVVLPENPGEGGRNQALAVAMARELAGLEDVAILAAGTDGTDGPTASAGGIVSGSAWQAVAGGEAALAQADSGAWLRKTGGLFITGPTGTNVMDLMLVLKQ